jgi:bilirubin oxidase
LNNVEIWNIVNNSPIGHPFHIHDVQFYILDRNGAAPAPEETGRKDVVFVPAMTSARFITAFEDFADEDTPYMYHCHMLTHEDGGMMGQFVVVDPSTIADAERERMSAPYPVPAHDHVALTHTGGSWSIWSIEGRLITRGQEQAKQFTVSTVDWEEGMYLFQSDETHHVQRFSVRH